jgi:hypothetical protein
VLTLPSAQRETPFADMDMTGMVISALGKQNATPLNLSQNQPLADWLEMFQQTGQLNPIPSANMPKQVLLLQTYIDTQHARQPGTAIGWLRLMTSDTMPTTLQYRLVAHAQLIDTATGQLIWQNQQSTLMTHLSSLNRSVGRVAGNQLILRQAMQRVSQQIASAYPKAVVPQPLQKQLAHQTWSRLKQLPAKLQYQFAP